MNLASWRLGSVTNSILVPRLAKAYGVVAAGWMGTGLPLGVYILSAFYLVSISDSASSEKTGRNINFLASLSNCPCMFWQLGPICTLRYVSINTFTNPAQLFLAAMFYGGDQRAAGSATS